MRIVILLDKSGSMDENKEQTIAGYNGFLESQKQLENSEKCLVSLYTFSNNVETVYENVLLSEATNLTLENYQPDGNTALYDSMADVLSKIADNERTIFLIITDGAENSSEHYNNINIREMIENKKEFMESVYIGSNQDAILAGNEIGSQISINYNDNNTPQVYKNLSAAMTRIRTGFSPQVEFTQDEIHSLIE